jgi:hypothetical protein
MNSEELFHMRHPNRLRVRRSGTRARIQSSEKRASEPSKESTQNAVPSEAVREWLHGTRRNPRATEGRHRKWMQNFSLHAGPPLWLLLKQR